MANVRIITDVTANLASELIERHRITVLPVEIRFGGETFHIDRETSPIGLFQKMARGPAQPSSASIAPHLFEEAYSRLCSETGDLLVILSSSKLNDAYMHARRAAGPFLGRCQITILDSMTASWGLGLAVEAAARAADAGQPLDDIVRLVRGILPHIYLVFFVERLDFLERGGRIRPAQALLGTMLRIKPLLFIEDGDIIPLEKVRTRLMAIEKVADFVAEFASIDQVVILSSPLESQDSDSIGELKEILSLSLPDQEFPVVEYDPVLACHLGPEALGVIVYEGP
jgi:DegV family protein with EDD domain